MVVYDPNQIKSAEPVVYDDNDNVIPISKRFDDKNNDTRYSIDVDDILKSPEQLKEIKLRSDILRDQLKLTDGTRRSVLRKSAAVGS